ncbi:MAG TPA: transcription termination factor NusA [Candidatus Latescibacteria bacterium]|nr:transcription termination factor NusA [Candidatus Latescibacterota bacterium]
MNRDDVLEALRQVAREKNVTMDLVIDTLEEGLLSAAKKKFGLSDNIDVEVDQNTGEIVIWAHKAVVEKVEDPAIEISLADAKKIDPEAAIGEGVAQPIPFTAFGRMAIQSAKQMLIQKVREAERQRVYETFREAISDIRIGTAQQVLRGDVIVDLGRAEGILPVSEQIPRDRYRQKDTVRAYVKDVLKDTKGPQVILSRTHPGFLERLFQMEVPEVYDGTVEVIAVARDPGSRAKVAVASRDDRVDPVGACIGQKGMRIQQVVRELNNERVDIIEWSPDPVVFFQRSLAPAEIQRVEVDQDRQTMIAIVDEDQLSIAIGRGGQNARLAAQLTGWRVEIMTEEQYAKKKERDGFLRVPVSELPGSTPAVAQALTEAGISSALELSERSAVEIADIAGISAERAAQLLDEATDLLEAKRQEYAERLQIPLEETGMDLATFVAEPSYGPAATDESGIAETSPEAPGLA